MVMNAGNRISLADNLLFVFGITMTNVEKLKEMLYGKDGLHPRQFFVSWNEEYKGNAEERAKILVETLENLFAGNFEDVTEQFMSEDEAADVLEVVTAIKEGNHTPHEGIGDSVRDKSLDTK